MGSPHGDGEHDPEYGAHRPSQFSLAGCERETIEELHALCYGPHVLGKDVEDEVETKTLVFFPLWSSPKERERAGYS